MSERPRYLTGLHVIHAFVVQELDIPISDSPTALRHLILTGPNGSGKSSILMGLLAELVGAPNSSANRWEQHSKRREELRSRQEPEYQAAFRTNEENLQALERQPLVRARGLDAGYRSVEHVLVFLGPKRDFKPRPVSGPDASRPEAKPGSPHLSTQFLQHLVNRRIEQLLAREDHDDAAADAIAEWFDSITEALRQLLGDPQLELVLDRKSYLYRLVLGGERPTAIEQLPDGLRSVLQIWAEILLHYESLEARLGHPPSGFVLIDEVELHLHAEMQEHLLPFLTSLFPTLQFIVTTHSPAVASSIGDATVYDLRTREATPSEELRGQRYGDLYTDWFGIETDFDLHTTAELVQLRELAAAKPGPDSPERATLEALARRLAERSHLLAIQIWRELEAHS